MHQLAISSTGSRTSCMDTNLLHTLVVGNGSAALAAAVAFPGKVTVVSRKG